MVRRTREHILETLSERLFASMLPAEWTCQRSQSDYGVDLRVEIFHRAEDGFMSS
jgi:hypothetical protein